MFEQIINGLFSSFGINLPVHLADALTFFVVDSIKIIFFLFMMIFLIGFLRTYIPVKKLKTALSNGKYGFPNLAASAFGAITPFCTCSSIPFFISFLKAGVPLGASLSFLITSPIVNEYLVVLMLGFFGWKITLIYIAVGMIFGVVLGIILGKMKLERELVPDMKETVIEQDYKTIKDRAEFGINEAKEITKNLWLWIVIGVGIGALIHGFIPETLIHAIMDKGGIFTVPLAVLIGVPIYANCAAVVPIAVVLFEKGVPLGTALAFMMATAALSLPEAVILRRVMKLKMIAIFFGIVALGMILIGYLFDIISQVIV